jgi:transposase
MDTHRTTNVVHLENGRGESLGKPLRVSNNRPGMEGLAAQLDAAARAGGYDGITLASEATGWYWLGAFYTLHGACAVPTQLYALNPRLTANYKKVWMNDDHADASDAAVIAERVRMGRDLPAPFAPETVYAPLRLLTRYRFHLAQAAVREKAYAANLVYLKASEYTARGRAAFSDAFGPTSRAVLTEFATCEAILATPVTDLAAWLDGHGRHHFADPAVTAQQLQVVARDSFVLPPAFAPVLNDCLAVALEQLAALERHIRRLDAAIAPRLQAIPNTLTTIPGIGPVFAAGLLAEIGDIRRFSGDDDKVAKYAGLKWRRHQSGEFEAEDMRLTRHCNRYLRYYFVEAADSVRNNEPTYAAYYAKKYAEVNKHQHKRAVVLTARKLVRLVTALLTTNQPYRAGSEGA